jgi:hypothetical protein
LRERDRPGATSTGRARGAGEMFENTLIDALGILWDFVVPEADDLKAFRFEI